MNLGGHCQALSLALLDETVASYPVTGIRKTSHHKCGSPETVPKDASVTFLRAGCGNCSRGWRIRKKGCPHDPLPTRFFFKEHQKDQKHHGNPRSLRVLVMRKTSALEPLAPHFERTPAWLLLTTLRKVNNSCGLSGNPLISQKVKV